MKQIPHVRTSPVVFLCKDNASSVWLPSNSLGGQIPRPCIAVCCNKETKNFRMRTARSRGQSRLSSKSAKQASSTASRPSTTGLRPHAGVWSPISGVVPCPHTQERRAEPRSYTQNRVHHHHPKSSKSSDPRRGSRTEIKNPKTP